MLNVVTDYHWKDENGNPAGGCSQGVGFTISWQNGPLGRGTERKEPNGAFVGTVIEAARKRLLYYQSSRFACQDNADAIAHLDAALAACNNRTASREARSVEGTYAT